MQRFSVICFTMALFSLGGCQKRTEAPNPMPAMGKPSTQQCLITMKVSGMMCGLNCPPKVKDALEAVPGVLSATADYPKRQAKALLDNAACNDTTFKELVDSLEDNGYTGEVINVRRNDV